MYVDRTRTYIGVVVDNEDPKKIGRCRIRVVDIFDDIPKEDIPWASPWKDLNGNSFNVPEKNKIVTVVFESGNIYKPEYVYAEHYNVNLENKLKKLSGKDYTSMKSIIFDHKTQIFVNDSDSLVIDYKMNQINITEGSINLNIKDNNSSINLGHENANQQAILGTNFMNWFDEFIANLLGEKGGPYLGNLAAPVVANPNFIEVCQKYRLLKEPKFLSHNVNLNDNKLINSNLVKTQRDRIQEGKVGDDWKTTKTEGEGMIPPNSQPNEEIDFEPKSSVTPEGNLTEASGDSNPNQPDTEQKKIPSADTEKNDEGEYILEQLKKINYDVYTKPFEMNIVGVRYQNEGSSYTNKFSDRLYLIYKNEQDVTKCAWYPISTIPGKYGSSKDKTLHKDLDKIRKRGGLGILQPAQYKNSWSIGEYHGEKCLRPGVQKFFRDNNYGEDKITYSKSDSGNAGMLIHKGFNRSQGKNTYGVYNWSEGCQVIQSPTDLDQIFYLLDKHKAKYGNKFTYTLITKDDVPEI